MHGVKRVRQSKHATEARQSQEKAKIDEYLGLAEEVISRKKNKDASRETLDLTSQLLKVNPEFYTIWNYRRQIFLDGIFPNTSLEDINTLISDELSNTLTALKAHPKVYWIWNHRRWCLESTPHGPGLQNEGDTDGWRTANWDRELYVVEKMLDADPRNFHAWNYRRYVLESMPAKRSRKSELAYTARKIEANISNFSAWHQRSKILQVDGKTLDQASRKAEFELLRNAMYTDPNDQSVWMYHRWLMGSGDDKVLLENEIEAIQELLDEQPDSKCIRCMESIVHYKRLLLRTYPDQVDKVALSSDCQGLLKQLADLDPMRGHRYFDMRRQLSN